MNLLTTLVLAFLVFFTSTFLSAQPVNFVADPYLLTLATGSFPHASCAVDMNGDGLDDVVRVGGKGLFIDFQEKMGGFRQKFHLNGLTYLPDWSICAGDLNNDGLTDLLFGNKFAASFLKAKNDGSGFVEQVMPPQLLSQRSTMADIDNDGWLDAFVCNDLAQSRPFRNLGGGVMAFDTNLIHTSSLPGNYSAIWTDFDNDRDIDLYISKCWAGALPGDHRRTNLLYRNDGGSFFTEIGALAGLDDNAQSWTTTFQDFDNDGDMDGFLVNHDQQNRFFRNNGDGTFTNVIADSGLDAIDLGAWENTAADFNNDGFMDIFSELKDELYLGNGDLTFSAQSLPFTPGAIADLNSDGFLDVIRKNQVFLNQGNANHWLKIRPLGIVSNRNGIGARVEIHGNWGIQLREIRSGESFSPMNSLNAHFGLGQNSTLDSLKIWWPSGIVTKLENLVADTVYVVPETSCPLPNTLLTIEKGPKICPGDTAVLVAPTGFETYHWSNGTLGNELKISHQGHFFAMLMDSAGCISLTQSVDIEFIEEKNPVIFSLQGGETCSGDTLVLAGFPTGINFDWSDGTVGAPSIFVEKSGLFTASMVGQCSAIPLVSEPFEVTVFDPPPPVVLSEIIDAGDSVLLTAVGENCHWFDVATGGNLLAVGSSFQTPPLTATTQFFVESRPFFAGKIQSGGKLDTAGAGGLPAQIGYLNFEVWSPFTLQSVSVFVPDAASATNKFVQLVSGESILAVKQFTVQPGWNVLELNFEVPVGTFSLRSPQGKMFRNAGQLDFPYKIGDVGRITSSSFGEGFYFFFYDWKIKKTDTACVSERAEVKIEVVATGEPQDEKMNRLVFYPNPAKDEIFIKKGRFSGSFWYRIMDFQGREMHRGYSENGDLESIDIRQLAVGRYFLQVFTDDFGGEETFLKFLKI